MLSSVAAAGVLSVIAAVQPAAAAVTMTLKARPQPRQYTLKAGYSVTVPDSWALAYVSNELFLPNIATPLAAH